MNFEDWWNNHGKFNAAAKGGADRGTKELMKLAFEVGREAVTAELQAEKAEVFRLQTSHSALYKDRDWLRICLNTWVSANAPGGWVDSLRNDANCYRWLREQHWTENTIAVVLKPKEAVKLGYDLPSGPRLDEVIIELMKRGST